MNIPALLIEYLITGGFAIVWVIPLLILFNLQPNLELYKPYVVLLGVPITYVLGLILDMFCGLIASRTKLKRKIRKQVDKSFKDKFGYLPEESSASIYIRLHNNDLANEFEKRSSRDRIARGTTLNLFLASFLVPLARDTTFQPALFQFLFLVVLTYASFQIWKVCEKRSYRFKLYSLKAVTDADGEK